MERRTGIGGFFGLELPEYGNFPQWHPGRSVAVNSGRRALEYILRRLGDVRCVRVPLYTCRTVVETMERLGIPVITYRIDERLEPEELPELEKGEYLLYTNYFGIKEKCVDRLASRYGGSLIVDNALALYSPARSGVASLYSPRKFSGLPDGGIAVMDAERSLTMMRRMGKFADRFFPEAEVVIFGHLHRRAVSGKKGRRLYVNLGACFRHARCWAADVTPERGVSIRSYTPGGYDGPEEILR